MKTVKEQERELLFIVIVAAIVCLICLLGSMLTGCGEAAEYEPDETRDEAAQCEIDLTDWVHVSELRCDDPYAGYAVVCIEGEAYELQGAGYEHRCNLVRLPISDRLCL